MLEARLAQAAGRELGVERHRADGFVNAQVAVPGRVREQVTHDSWCPFDQVPRSRNTRLKLLAGMATRSTNSKPCSPASARTSAVSRTPHAWSCARRLASNAALLGAVWRRSSLNGP